MMEAITFCRPAISQLTQKRRHLQQTCYGHLINHKANEDSPNLKFQLLVVEHIKRPFLVATRDIPAGEELYFDYGV